MALKKCKGTGRAIGYGCGEPIKIHRYGLCLPCFKDWLFNSESGLKTLKKAQISARKITEKTQREKRKQQKESIKSKSFFEKQLQSEINSVVRLIDSEKGCISCEHGWDSTWTRQRHAGHFFTTKAHPNLRYNLFNIFGQCSICNNYLSGNERAYEKGLIKHYGQDMLNAVKSLPATISILNLSITELKEKIAMTRKILQDILSGKDYTREEINKRIGIYKT
jgi:hypothetical protein